MRWDSATRGWAVAAIVACSLALGCGGEAECGAAECADICAKAAPAPEPAEAKAKGKSKGKAKPGDGAAAGMSPFEDSLIGPLVDDVRAGVRPFDAKGIGLCKGVGRTCDDYLGNTPGELPAGDYSIQAHLRVPNVGEKGTWKVRFETHCTTIRTTSNGESRSESDYDKEYDVVFAGEDKGYTLAPLRKVTSPGKHGRQECTYTITAPHPDGDKVYEGAWSVPDGSS